MEFWVDKSNGEVKVALSITVSRRKRITIERWTLGRAEVSPSEKVEIQLDLQKRRPKITGSLQLTFAIYFSARKEKERATLSLLDQVCEISHRVFGIVLKRTDDYVFSVGLCHRHRSPRLSVIRHSTNTTTSLRRQ